MTSKTNFAELSRRFATPFYCYDASIIRRRTQELESAFAAQRVKLFYAVKANDNPAIIRCITSGGIGACLVSLGEFRRALRANASPARMLMNGVGKTREEIDAVLRARIGQLNVESLPELETVATAAESLGLRVPICLRINPEIEAGGHSHTKVARRNDKFGLPIEDLPAAREMIGKHPVLDWKGYSCHIGSQIRGTAELKASYHFMVCLFQAERVSQPQFDRLDLGGGFGVARSGAPSVDPAQYAEMIGAATADLQRDGVTIQLEPGRMLIAEAGALITKVLRVKEFQRSPPAGVKSRPRFIVVDAGMNDLLRPALYDADHPIGLARQSQADRATCCVVGPVCESADTFSRACELPDDIVEGDVLIIAVAGAYGHTMASMYNARDLLGEVLIDGESAELIRRTMTAAEYDEMTLSAVTRQ